MPQQWTCKPHSVTFDPDVTWCKSCATEEMQRIQAGLLGRVSDDASYANTQRDHLDELGYTDVEE